MHLLILAPGSRDERILAADISAFDILGGAGHSMPLNTARLPFNEPPGPALSAATPRVLRLDDLERAFPDNQTGGTRLVLTQSMYLLQKLLDRLDPDDRIVATADAAILQRRAPEAFERRGPWRLFEVVAEAQSGQPPVSGTVGAASAGAPAGPAIDAAGRLAFAYSTDSVETRLAMCQSAAADEPRSAVAHLALASVLRELQQIDAARQAFERAIELAPGWEAAHYEIGKFWLWLDDMEQARDGFQRAATIMPSFAAAHSNLGATLGELEDPQRALAAFWQARAFDPTNFTILNNIGVVSRELGELDRSEEVLTQVVTLAPAFIFGHYNLGHTRFLRGDYPGALAAYEEGQRRDPEKNRRQGCRLAMVRFASGDAARAEQEFWHFADQASGEEREDLLLEACEIAQALLETHSELAPLRPFIERIAAQISL